MLTRPQAMVHCHPVLLGLLMFSGTLMLTENAICQSPGQPNQPAQGQPTSPQAVSPADRPLAEDVGSVADLGTRSAGQDWPQFLGPNYDSSSPEVGIRKDWSAGKLPLLWSREVGTSYGIGSVAAGRYLQFERIGDAERLTCLHAETGELLWSSDQPVRYEDMYGYNNGPRTSPTIVGNLVYTLGVAGQLCCRTLESGEKVWSSNVNQQYGVIQNFFGVGASPLVVDDLVIVMVGGSPAADQRLPPGMLDRVSPNGSALVAFNRFSGQEVYRVGDYLASYSSPRPMVWKDQTWILAFMREGLLAVDAASGQQQWMVPWRSGKIESVNAAVPLVADDQILISECYEIGSALLQIGADGKPKLLRQDPRNSRLQSFRAHWATPIKVGDFVYGSSGRNPGDTDFRCIDWESGEVLWSVPRRERTSGLKIDDHIVVLGEQGEMSLLRPNPERYEIVTSFDLSVRDASQPARPPLRSPCWAAPIVAHGLLYVRGDRHLLCFELIPEDQN